MATYVGRHRRARYAGTRRPVAKRRIVVAREVDQTTITTGNTTRTPILTNLESRLGEEVWGATILGIYGVCGVTVAGTATTNPGAAFIGAIVSRSESADLGATHPNPSYVNTNNDRYSSWYGRSACITGYSTTATGITNTGVQRLYYSWKNPRQRIVQPEDTLLFCYAYDFGSASSSMIFLNVCNVVLQM